MADIVELKLDRDLIDPDFAGYKLSLDPVPIYERNLETRKLRLCFIHLITINFPAVFVAQVGENQISYAHARVFSLHNHLIVNSYAPDLLYFVDDDWNIFQVNFGKLSSIWVIVFLVPRCLLDL